MKLFGMEKEKNRHNVPEGLFILAEKVTGSVMKNRILHVNRADIGQYRSHLHNFEKLYDKIKSKERENAKTVWDVLLWLGKNLRHRTMLKHLFSL